MLKQPKNSVINISGEHIPEDVIEILSLGMNTHLKQKFDNFKKKVSIEKLYSSIKSYENENLIKVECHDALKSKLKLFGLKNCVDFNSDILTREQYKTLNVFKNRTDIVVRAADKSNVFVIMKRDDYVTKINNILSDQVKFQVVAKDPTLSLKRELNKHIAIVNSVQNGNKLSKLVGHYEPGYIYANPKIHKRIVNPPIRPIVSQIGTPTCQVAKELNAIIVKYMPGQYTVQSTSEFLSLVQHQHFPSTSILASLDVESLFTNVPVVETVNIILQYVYHHPTLSPPTIPLATMKDLLILCTTRTPFHSVNGSIYQQKDGVMMGSSLGCTFANYYMAHLEEKVFNANPQAAPLIYARYVDDVFLLLENINQLHDIKTLFENNSVLRFTYEEQKNNQLVFLDVLLQKINNEITTSVYTKETSTGDCINYSGVCPEQYKTGLVKTLLQRAYNISSDWQIFSTEVERVKQRLVNNKFPMYIIGTSIRQFLNTKLEMQPNQPMSKIPLYYESQMCCNYKLEEKQLHHIINTCIKPVKERDKISLQIYKKLRNVAIRNKERKNISIDNEYNVVYQYTCDKDECHSVHKYIGYTEQTLQERFR